MLRLLFILAISIHGISASAKGSRSRSYYSSDSDSSSSLSFSTSSHTSSSLEKSEHRISRRFDMNLIRSFEDFATEYDAVLENLEILKGEIADIDGELINLALDDLEWNCAEELEAECVLQDRLERRKAEYHVLVAKRARLRKVIRQLLKRDHHTVERYYEELEDISRSRLKKWVDTKKYSEILTVRELISKCIYYRVLVKTIFHR